MMATLPLSQQKFQVHSPLLLSLYLIVPVCLLFVLYDQIVLDGLFRDNYLPTNPAALMLWAVIFNFPHILSSMITLADKEYIDFYRERFLTALKVIVVVVLAVNVLMPMVLPKMLSAGMFAFLFAIFATYTMYHVLSQQFGIGMMLMKVRPSKDFEYWRWLSTISATAMYFMVFFNQPMKKVIVAGVSAFEVAFVISAIFAVLGFVQGYRLSRQSQRDLGRYYVYSNMIMLLVSVYFLSSNYLVFAIVMPRFVHDLTAFIIYSVHDQNRNLDVKRNYFYRLLRFLPLPPIILCPILAIFLANSIECGFYLSDVFLGFNAKGTGECIIQRFYAPEGSNGLPQSMQLWMQVMFICGFFHYYIEGFVWKREAIHRHSVSFT